MLILVHVVYELNAQSGNLKAAPFALGVGARRPRLTGVSVVFLELVAALRGGSGEPPVDATREMCIEAHRAKFGSACLQPDMQTKKNPADLAAVDFDIWVLQWAVANKIVCGVAPSK